ncbi:hypothetical protein FRC96_07870 [Lujinxingia vulgaris]|uniref:Uncharacterized protein n=2 Tax=Lujinxingia vulgaris TaxID=2600176 RepID=A0A5C6XBZ0_9DELT|nr:hypothetical protein FRC96_07870 [Lujinxingia vulgaris]
MMMATTFSRDLFMHTLRRLLVMSFFALALLATSFASTASAQTPDFSGSYVLDEAASDDFLAAFEPALEEMNAIKRALARRYLKKSDGPDTRMSIEQSDETFTVQGEDRTPVAIPLSGERISREGEDGKTVHFTAGRRGEVVRVTMFTEGGPFRTDYRMLDDGRMEIRVRVENEHLPLPVTYRLVYRAQ